MDIEGLAKRYPLVVTKVTAAGRDWQITSVTDQSTLIDRVKTEEDLQNFPYGLMLWPSALGLAAKITAIPELVRGRAVLEIGAGIGLSGLAAAVLGAQVTQTDFLDDALTLCAYNAEQNSITGVAVRKGDWRDWPADLGPFPVVIASDILYERSLHSLLCDLFPRLVRTGGTILLSDPIRPQALDFIELLEKQGGWEIAMEPIKVSFDGQPKDLAIFRLTYRGA